MRSDPSLMLPSTTASGSESRQSSTHSHSRIFVAIQTVKQWRQLTPSCKVADAVKPFVPQPGYKHEAYKLIHNSNDTTSSDAPLRPLCLIVWVWVCSPGTYG